MFTSPSAASSADSSWSDVRNAVQGGHDQGVSMFAGLDGGEHLVAHVGGHQRSSQALERRHELVLGDELAADDRDDRRDLAVGETVGDGLREGLDLLDVIQQQ